MKIFLSDELYSDPKYDCQNNDKDNIDFKFDSSYGVDTNSKYSPLKIYDHRDKINLKNVTKNN